MSSTAVIEALANGGYLGVKERLIKFAAMLIVAPMLVTAMVLIGCVMLSLPIVALIAPKLIKFRSDE